MELPIQVTVGQKQPLEFGLLGVRFVIILGRLLISYSGSIRHNTNNAAANRKLRSLTAEGKNQGNSDFILLGSRGFARRNNVPQW